jgi:hypothetical protein
MAQGETMTIDSTAVLSFLTAGRAVCTVVSRATNTRFTFKVTDGKSGWRFVSVLSGPDDYRYLGAVTPEGKPVLTKASRSRGLSMATPSWRAFSWLWNSASKNPDALNQADVYHSGKCGRCGRALTVPESLRTGLGPVCAKLC